MNALSDEHGVERLPLEPGPVVRSELEVGGSRRLAGGARTEVVSFQRQPTYRCCGDATVGPQRPHRSTSGETAFA